MYKKTIFILFFIISCSSSEVIQNQEKSIKWFFNKEGYISTTYQKHNLRKEIDELYFKDSLIQTENKNYYYHYEIFDNRYLLTSINKKPNIWSSPTIIPKDSLYVLDLKTFNKSFISLKKTQFTLNKTQLIKTYDKNIILDDSISYQYAIDSVNLVTNELYLVNPNLKVIKYNLKKVN
jgi:hypothetical protein